MAEWTWASARRRGTSHIKSGTPCQDAVLSATVRDGGRLLGIVSDGAGSAAHGGPGAFITTRTMVEVLLAQTPSSVDLPTDDDIWSGLDAARDRIGLAAASRGLSPRDFAATMVLAIADSDGAVLALVGDGAAAVRTDGVWSVPSWPEHGEYASTTYFVTDEPQARMRIVRLQKAPDAIVLMSDGLERLALDFTAQTPHHPFFETMVKPVETSATVGRDQRLSQTLAHYLGRDAVNARTDDDKSLLIAVRR